MSEPATYHDGIRDASQAIAFAMREEAQALRALIDDEDTSCPARDIRRERVRTMDYVENLTLSLIDWEWEVD